MLIIEDGTIVANANTYITLQEADDYLLPRGLWGANSDTPEEMIAKKEQSIIRACDYMNTLLWKGVFVDEAQDLSFPRVFDGKKQEVYIIPKIIKKAQMEIAGMIYSGTDFFAPVDKGVIQKTEIVDVLEETTKWADVRPDSPLYKNVMGLLRPYLLRVEGEVDSVTYGRFRTV